MMIPKGYTNRSRSDVNPRIRVGGRRADDLASAEIEPDGMVGSLAELPDQLLS